jgi:2-polyprenyl-3-methyl-5-hydroxy-6-metoxy-1,4-benzoquinol methylase
MPDTITLKCEKEIADTSLDHLHPLGTRWDNNRNLRFTQKLCKLYDRSINVLDLGCSGGGFVKDCIDMGNLAVGLEGSDFSKKLKRAAWRSIPENLFTCDVTKSFDIYKDGKPLMFNVITAWDVMEHINQEDLAAVVKNIKKHLAKDGIVVMSIADCPSYQDGVDLHRTQKPKEWWIELFAKHGLVYRKEYFDYFNTQYVGGKGEKKANFHMLLSLPDSTAPKPPHESLQARIYDKWHRSLGNRILYRITQKI